MRSNNVPPPHQHHHDHNDHLLTHEDQQRSSWTQPHTQDYLSISPTSEQSHLADDERSSTTASLHSTASPTLTPTHHLSQISQFPRFSLIPFEPNPNRDQDPNQDPDSNPDLFQDPNQMMTLSTSPDPTLPSYPGEDTRPTSTRELLGFYTYSFAAEVYVVCGLGAFIPILLEGLARASHGARLAGDRERPCVGGLGERGLVARVLEAIVESVDAGGSGSGGGRTGNSGQCVVSILGAEVNTASFAMYTFSISVLLQALVVVTMSGAADHGRFRKTLMIVFAGVGAIATMLFLVVTPGVFVLGSLWAIIGNVCFGASFVLLNSFLPLLVRNHPSTRSELADLDYDAQMEDDDDLTSDTQRQSLETPTAESADPTEALLPSSSDATSPYLPSQALPSAQMQLSTKISAYGVSIGYGAAVLAQTLSIGILTAMGATLFSLKIVLLMIGSWWLLFTIPAAIFMRPRPGPPLIFGKIDGKQTWLGYLSYSWKNLYRTMLRARRLRDVLLFLAAWFLISDAIATVSSTSVLFARTTLGMEASALALVNVVTTLSGIIGALLWSRVSRMMQLKPSHTILTCICLFELIPLWGLLGYIPAIKKLGYLGLQQPWELYPLGALYGIVLGGISSYARSLYGELIPPGSEAAFYALYAITDKGSSVFGPAIVGAITDATGDIRPAFWFLALLIGLPIPLMLLVNVERGKIEGAKLARESLTVSVEHLAASRTLDHGHDGGNEVYLHS